MHRDTAPIRSSPHRPQERSPWPLRLLFSMVGVALVACAVAVVWLVADTARSVVGRTPASAMPASLTHYTTPGQGVEQVVEDPDAAPNVWDQHGPVNILLLGLDTADCAAPAANEPLRADTIIIVRVDPRTRRAAMLSIPRDLYVFVPGRGARKINTTHAIGHDPSNPHAAPALLARTLRDNLEISVQRYIRVDFEAFERMIDDGMGGLDMDLPPSADDPAVALLDTRYPDDRCGTMTVRFEPGPQHLTGAQALQYARSRYSTSDFDRSRRQMEVLLAIKERGSSAAILPRLPRLLPAVLKAVDTDLSATEILSLARVARSVKREDVISLRMDEAVVYPDMLVIDGVQQAVLRHNQRAFDALRAQFLGLVPPTPTPAPSPTTGAVTPTP